MATKGHENESVRVSGLKSSLQKLKDDLLGIPNTSEAVYYTQQEADAYNAELTGALNSTDPLTAEQAAAYNAAVTGATKEAGDTLSAEEAAAYNATLDGAVTTQDAKTPAVPKKVKDYVDDGLGAKADKPTYSPVYEAVASPTGNPSELGYYEIVSNEYVLSQDTTVDSEKTYYIQKSYYKMTI